jgi:N-acetylmuramoyl-L-alanine amidase
MATPTSTPTSSVQLPPTPRPAGTPLRVGIQVGHWLSNELPDELARLRTSSGAFAAGYTEAEVNLDIARRVAALLERDGIAVDVLPATIPPAYDADVFVSLHADGSSNAGARGFKLATPWRTSRASQHLLDALTAEYAAATGLPQDGAITFNMRGYYAFSYRRHEHAVAKTTPAVIIEMGFLTSAADRALLIGQPDTVAVGIANGIVRYLNERDPLDGAALLPPEFKTHRPASPDGVDVYAAPRDDAPVISHAAGDRRLFVFQERDGWYQIFVRGNSRVTGWVRKDAVMETNDPTPTPMPATDS